MRRLFRGFLALAVVGGCGVVDRGTGVYGVGEGYRSANGSVMAFSVGADGTLTAAATASITAGQRVADLAVTADGKFGYILSNSTDEVFQFGVAANGTFTALTTAKVATDGSPFRIVVTPAGTFAYVVTFDSTVNQYSIGADGSLTALSPASVALGQPPSGVVVTPDGKFLYVATQSQIQQFIIGTDGKLTPHGTPTLNIVGGSNQDIVIDAAGKFVYLSSSGPGEIFQFSVGADGGLTALSPTKVASGGTTPEGMDILPSGTTLYVVNNDMDHVAQFKINANGTLEPLSTPNVATGDKPKDIAVHPGGGFAYTINGDFNGSTFSQFSVGADGSLTALSPASVDGTETSPERIFAVSLP